MTKSAKKTRQNVNENYDKPVNMTVHTSDGKENQSEKVDKSSKYSRKLNKLKNRLIRTKNNLFSINKKQKTMENGPIEPEIDSSRYQSMPNLSKIVLDDDEDDNFEYIDSEGDQSDSFDDKLTLNNLKRKKSVPKKNQELPEPLKETKIHSKRIKFF